MRAQYIFRLDDITPRMNWDRFDGLMRLLRKHSVKPLLGIVPDNRDPKLNCQSEHPRFWEIMHDFQERGEIDVAQHGYQHLLVARPTVLSLRTGTRNVSEFAGEPYHDQVFKITEGNRILLSRGIKTNYWMAPNHSFDETTLRALVDVGFTAVSDGISLYPFTYAGLVFVPQQTWRPYWMPCGVQTICLHTNTITPREVKLLRAFLRGPHEITSFSKVLIQHAPRITHTVADLAFQAAYHTAWRFTKGAKKTRQIRMQPPKITTPLGSKPPLQSHLGN